MNTDADAAGPDRRARLFVIYLFCGAVCGVLIGLLDVGVGQAFVDWEPHEGSIARFWAQRRSLFQKFLDGGASGCFLGIVCAFVTVYFAGRWKQLRHPISAASLWSSVFGSVFLVNWVLFNRNRYSPEWALTMLTSHFTLGAAYGLMLSVAVRLFERGLKLIRRAHDQSREVE